MRTVTVSVVIPNYNHAAYLQQRIESVLQQTYKDFEVIILDDSSTDNSLAIIDKYRSHPQIAAIVCNKENGGSAFRQWEKGIALAKGDYVWIAESDDWCEVNLLEVLMNQLTSNPDCVIGYCQSYCIDNENDIRFQSVHNKLVEKIDGAAFIDRYMVTNNAIFNASAVVWKKEKFSLVSKAFMDYHLCGDWLFWIELARTGSVIVSGRLLNFFRKHGQDVSGAAYRSGLSILEETRLAIHLHDNGFISRSRFEEWMVKQQLEFNQKEHVIEAEKAAAMKLLLSSQKFLPKAVRRSRLKSSVKSYVRKLIDS